MLEQIPISDQVVNFSNALLSVTGIFLGFAIAAVISVFIEFLNSLINFVEEQKKNLNKAVEKKMRLWVLFFVLVSLCVLTTLLLFSVTDNLTANKENISRLEEGVIRTKILNAIKNYNNAVWVMFVGMLIILVISVSLIVYIIIWKNNTIKIRAIYLRILIRLRCAYIKIRECKLLKKRFS